MRKDDPLSRRSRIRAKDLLDKPLLLSQEESDDGMLARWFDRDRASMHVIISYNLLFNASIFVEEGLGYAICLDGILNTTGESPLCFRPLSPALDADLNIIWKKYRTLSKPPEKFLNTLKEYIAECETAD